MITFIKCTRHVKSSGWACITPCEQRGRPYYWCYTREVLVGWEDARELYSSVIRILFFGLKIYFVSLSDGGWARCSPNPGTDAVGQPCTTECQEYHTGHFFCHTEANSTTDNCGITLIGSDTPTIVAKHRTRYGQYCLSTCEKGANTYASCATKDGGSSDYCSEKPGHDVYGRKCVDTCDYHGEAYTFCHMPDGNWSYCGTIGFDSEIEFTYLGSKCLSPCRLRENSTEMFCYDATRTEQPCSSVHGVATNNLACTGACGTRGNGGHVQSYQWCRTHPGQELWSHCSNPEPDHHLMGTWWNKMEYFPKRGIRSQFLETGSLENLIRYRDDQGSDKVTIYEKVEHGRQYSIQNRADMLAWFTECLNKWRAKRYRVFPQRGTARLADAGSDLRGVRMEQHDWYWDRNRIESINIQMQVRGLTRRQNQWRSIVIAEVHAPVSVVEQEPEHVISALLISLHRGYTVNIARFGYREYEEGERTRGRLSTFPV